MMFRPLGPLTVSGSPSPAGGRAFAVGADLAAYDGVTAHGKGVRAGFAARAGRAADGAPFFLVQQLLPVLRDGGSTVDIGSGVTRIALADEPAYAMTKGARESFTRTLANVVGGRRITVDTVAPGPTETAGLTARPAASPEWSGCRSPGRRCRGWGSRRTSPTRWRSWPRRTGAGSPVP
ncbi:SDR family oxidoreductase [Streptomyces sp. NPDC048717]|uniref:SDR family oxidoreductase n=1 Tax=Streptomyces sp. NPDC048717 TaxID=3154928 RepID=UPI003428A684